MPTGDYTFAKSLSGATLAPMTITVEQIECDEKGANCTVVSSREVDLAVTTWTGVGTINTFSSKYKSTYGGCTTSTSGKGAFRQANVALGGVPIAEGGFLGISTGKFKVSCS